MKCWHKTHNFYSVFYFPRKKFCNVQKQPYLCTKFTDLCNHEYT